MPHQIEQFEGALLGCANGDALGAPYEGLWAGDIPCKTELLDGFGGFDGYPQGQFTDDTQLTLATVEAIIEANEIDPAVIAHHLGELWKSAKVIGPGGACMEAGDRYLQTHNWKTCGAPVGRAGNGTAMRTGFLGLCFPTSATELPEVAADISSLTHLDPRSIAGGVGVTQLTHSLATFPDRSTKEHLLQTSTAMRPFHAEFADIVDELESFIGKPRAEVAHHLATPENNVPPEFSEPIITPYIIPTVVAAFWSVLSHPTSWTDAVYEAIALGGDVDTLGAIVGTVMGAKLGVEAIPSHLVENVQESANIRLLARRLYSLAMGLKPSP